MSQINGLQRGSILDLKNTIAFVKTKALSTGDLVYMALKFGSGQLSLSKSAQYNYQLNRGKLDDLTEGDDQPMQVSFDARFTFYLANLSGAVDETRTLDEIVWGIDTGNSEEHGNPIFQGTREDWLSAYGCPPYCFELEIHNNPGIKCPGTDAVGEATLVRYLRCESLNADFAAGTITFSGTSHTLRPVVARCATLGKSTPSQTGSGVFTYNLEADAEPMDASDGNFWTPDPRSIA